MKSKVTLIKSIISVAALLLLLGVSTNSSAYWGRDATYVVKCDAGMTPQHILDMQWFARPIELQLVGICPGFTINRDDVTVTARDNEACPGATVDGKISISGARNATLACISVMGGESGVAVSGGKAFLGDVHISGSNESGIWIDDSGTVEMSGGSITDTVAGVFVENGYGKFYEVDISSNRGTAVTVENNSFFEMSGGSISNNAEDGVAARRNSVLKLYGVAVTGNDRYGVALFNGADAFFDGVAIEDNVRSGLFARKMVSADFRGGSIVNNHEGISFSQHSFIFVSWSEIVYNRDSGVLLRSDSGAYLWNGADISENMGPADIVCEGEESSVQIHGGANIGSMDCPHPDF